jgi:pimeloyl-ACP methyl ester carboxylesterase
MKRLKLALFLCFVITVANGAFAAPAERTEMFKEIRVTVRGEGRPLIMVPGLNSAGAVWDETCAELQAVNVQCHILQLPGFAGLAAMVDDNAKAKFLSTVRDNLLSYIDAKKLQKPMMIGHSLGGELALQMAIKAPSKLERIIIVDSLPFFPAATAPTATATTAKPMADGMKTGMTQGSLEMYHSRLKGNLSGMTLSEKRLETLLNWGLSSDRATTTQAMYELMTIDLRDDLAKITSPTLVLGAWAAYAQYGSTIEAVRKTYTDQYANLKGARIEMSETGYHFLMWDDPQWLVAQVKAFIAAPNAPPKATP